MKNIKKLIRLNKYIAYSGICSRRKADKLIKIGLISVNGKIIKQLGYKVNYDDNIKYVNSNLKFKNKIYILFNKPKNCITTVKDNKNRKIIMDFIPNIYKKLGIFPIGRLDKNTTGLLLLTNDGKLSQYLTHPKYKIKRKYKIYLNKNLNKKDLLILKNGIKLKEGKIKINNIKIFNNNKKSLIITITVGWNKIIHRIFNKIGYKILYLNRIYFAGLKINNNIKLGQYKILSKDIINNIKNINNIHYNEDC
ncbi:pseudouridine synthase [Candidatus Shikimatogenerans bostrichidophilus]|uniref:pseudouridine synthase n=1 Tax=Candidatus Shikimatogenerans bostrichidophilus TaxID=2943807 RepID=UPI002966325A